MAAQEFDVVLESQSEGGFTAYVPDLPGCISEGDAVDDALAMIRDAIEGYLAVQAERGEPLPDVQHHKVAVAA